MQRGQPVWRGPGSIPAFIILMGVSCLQSNIWRSLKVPKRKAAAIPPPLRDHLSGHFNTSQ